jgi:hypothetical protein
VNDSSATWYYARDGQQNGPVALAELQRMAAAGLLDPRKDMVWTEGMGDWQPAGGVEGIFERRAAPGEVAPAAAVPTAPDRYESQPVYDADAAMMQQVDWPGVRRRVYISVAILLPFLVQIAIAVIAPLAGMTEEAVALVSGGVSIVLFILTIFFGLQRLANVGMTRWWYLGLLVPILNLWVGYRMFACPAGYAYHKKLDGPGVALAILYWLMIALFVLFVAAVVLMAFGLLGNFDMQELLDQIKRVNSSSGQ